MRLRVVVVHRALTTAPVNGGIVNGIGMVAFTTAARNGGIVNGTATLAFTTVPLNGGIFKIGTVGTVDAGATSFGGSLTV